MKKVCLKDVLMINFSNFASNLESIFILILTFSLIIF